MYNKAIKNRSGQKTTVLTRKKEKMGSECNGTYLSSSTGVSTGFKRNI